VVGANETARGQYGLQQRYNIAYAQCMYSRGNQVAGYQAYGPPLGAYPQGNYPPPPQGGYPPPPPPGNYPPPPR
jgi:hypothetical protein